MLGSPDAVKAGEAAPKSALLASQNVRPGVVIILSNGAIVYDGLLANVPPEVLHMDTTMIVHPHMRDQITANAKRMQKADREEQKRAEKMARLGVTDPRVQGRETGE